MYVCMCVCVHVHAAILNSIVTPVESFLNMLHLLYVLR